MIKFRKTKANKRIDFEYEFVDGTKVVLKPGVDGVTELDIKELYAYEDAEVYNNIKNHRKILNDKERAEKKQWEKENRGKEWDAGWSLSVDGLQQQGVSLDKSTLFSGYATNSFAEEDIDPRVYQMREAVKLLNPDQQYIYKRITEGAKQVEIAKELGISKSAMQSRMDKLKARLKKLI
ncbi:hypothetical protein B6L06_05140 [Listeria monocytogenes]|uniref:hypothetical protein n=1 Tax=Lactococcus petauri TaxID=1940789 RepID=UPI0018437C30|nr:hypothetical protein [Listeria monocytogenes]